MSFEESLLDGFDALGKRTALSLEATKGLGSLFKKLSLTLGEFSTKTDAIVTKYKGKKMQLLDGTVRSSVETVLKDIETIVRSQSGFAEQLLALSRDAEAFVKERDKARKKLVSDADALTKDWESQLAQLKKAKENYQKLAKETAAMRSKENDPKKPKDFDSKLKSATEKSTGAEDKYNDVLRDTNAKQKRYYSHDQPALLQQFQEFEEARIVFARGTLDKFHSQAQSLALPSKWDAMLASASSAVSSIDTKSDIESFVNTARTNVRVPDAIPFESYDGSTIAQSAGADRSSGSSSSARPVSIGGIRASLNPTRNAPPPPAAEPDGPLPTPPAAEPAPPAAVFVPPPPAESQQPAPPAVQDDVPKPAAPAPDDADKRPRFRALYDYTGANETELNMKEGDIVAITETDESGWWYANKGDKSGFVPANYLTPV